MQQIHVRYNKYTYGTTNTNEINSSRRPIFRKRLYNS